MWWLEFTAVKGKRSKQQLTRIPVSLGPFTEGVCSATELQGPLGTSHVTEKHIIHASGSRGYCWMSVLRSKYGIKTESQKNQWKLVHNSKTPFPPSTEQDKKVGGSSTLGKDSRGDSLGWLSCKSQTPDSCSNGGVSDWCWGNTISKWILGAVSLQGETGGLHLGRNGISIQLRATVSNCYLRARSGSHSGKGIFPSQAIRIIWSIKGTWKGKLGKQGPWGRRPLQAQVHCQGGPLATLPDGPRQSLVPVHDNWSG